MRAIAIAIARPFKHRMRAPESLARTCTWLPFFADAKPAAMAPDHGEGLARESDSGFLTGRCAPTLAAGPQGTPWSRPMATDRAPA
eukprot:537523-Alexandrium_andersonii.AAC.1